MSRSWRRFSVLWNESRSAAGAQKHRVSHLPAGFCCPSDGASGVTKKRYLLPGTPFTISGAILGAECRGPGMPKSKPLSSREELLSAAREAMSRAYATYSKFKVGAAILTESGEVFQGCNVENASYGMTNCAERTAIFAAVARLGPSMKIRTVVVVNSAGAPCSPCGACRQVILEFGPKARVVFQGQNGFEEAAISELLPYGFRLK